MKEKKTKQNKLGKRKDKTNHFQKKTKSRKKVGQGKEKHTIKTQIRREEREKNKRDPKNNPNKTH